MGKRSFAERQVFKSLGVEKIFKARAFDYYIGFSSKKQRVQYVGSLKTNMHNYSKCSKKCTEVTHAPLLAELIKGQCTHFSHKHPWLSEPITISRIWDLCLCVL